MSDVFSAFETQNLGLNDVFATVGNNGVDYAAMNKGITAVFFMQTSVDQRATDAAGTLRTRDDEMVMLRTTGDHNSAPVHPVTDALRERFHEAYKRWKETKKNDHIDGTPLSHWPMISAGFCMELKALNILSVEHLAECPDSTLHRILDGNQWRERAKAWLGASKDAGIAASIAAQNDRLKESNEDLQRQIRELGARLDAQSSSADAPKRGPGRPAHPKEQAA